MCYGWYEYKVYCVGMHGEADLEWFLDIAHWRGSRLRIFSTLRAVVGRRGHTLFFVIEKPISFQRKYILVQDTRTIASLSSYPMLSRTTSYKQGFDNLVRASEHRTTEVPSSEQTKRRKEQTKPRTDVSHEMYKESKGKGIPSTNNEPR